MNEEDKIVKISIVMFVYKIVAVVAMIILMGLHLWEYINRGQISNWSQALFYFLFSGSMFGDSYVYKDNKTRKAFCLYGGVLMLVVAVAFLYEFATTGK